MNILIVYAHHEPSSFTAALKNVTIESLQTSENSVKISDLYGQGFTAVAANYDFQVTSGNHFNYMLEQKNAAQHNLAFSPDIVEEINRVKEADLIIFHFPIWWFSVPAILKGWFDRVLVMGAAWDGHGLRYERGLLRGKKALLVATAGGTSDLYQKEGVHKATMNEVLHPVLHGTLAFCGMDVLQPYVIYDILQKTDDERAQILELYRQHIVGAVTDPHYYSRYEG